MEPTPHTPHTAVGSPHGTSSEPTEGLSIRRYFTAPGVHPFEAVQWELRDARIGHGDKVSFEQRQVEFPKSWSQNATNIVAQKYFRGQLDSPTRERSVKQMIGRVAGTIAGWGREHGYFATDEDGDAFEAELTHILLHQMAAFNSPVWFNVGFEESPQCSACLPYHALVSTPDGMVPIGELVEGEQVGREVYDSAGTTTVVAVKENGRKPVWRVKLRNGSFVEATGDHVVKAAFKRRSTPVWLRVDELRPGMRLHLHPHRAKVGDRQRVAAGGAALEDAPELGAADDVAVSEAALAGWLQADGFVGQYQTGTNRSLTIEFQVANEDEYEWVVGHLDVVFPDVHRKVRDADTKEVPVQRIRLYGEVLRDFVTRWELLNRRTDIRVPTRLWTASQDEISAYLRSIFQADGYVTVRHDNGCEQGRIAFAVIGERWTEDVQLLLMVLGIYSRRVHKREPRPDRHDLHEVAVSIGSERARFAELVGFPGREKSEKLIRSLGLRGLKHCPDLREEEILAIEPQGVQDVYDIQTESGEFLTNNIAVHNCFILSVEDDMDSILEWNTKEGKIFRGGSGSGINLSKIRGSMEPLSKGGTASGPVSFMRGADSWAGTIKSGGKCFREGTLVATPTGMQPIERLRIGDEVLTHKGPRAVADFMSNGRRQCYRVLTTQGYELEVTAGHKFAYWRDDEGGFDVKPIEEFEPGDPLYAPLLVCEGGAPIPLLAPEIADPTHATTTVEMDLPTVLDERLAYVLGLIYGDGNLRTESPYRVHVTFCKDDAGRESADRFSHYCRELFGEEPLVLGDYEGYRVLGYTRKRLVEFLVANGLAKGKGDTLGFPEVLLRSQPEIRAAFVAGVIDADGSYQRRGGWAVSSVDRAFLVNLQRLLVSLGIPSKIKLNRERRGNWRPLYKLHIVGFTFVDRLVDYIEQHSAKAQVNYVPSAGADKGWGYRPSVFRPLTARVQTRGGRHIVERSVGMNETSGFRAVARLAEHPDSAVAEYAEELSSCVQLTLESVTPTDIAETYDIEVEDVHLLCANGVYASNTRRAAKMLVLDVDHPDIRDFIWCKAKEEDKAAALRDAGFDMSIDGDGFYSIQYQNANNSVRVTDEFMRAVENDEPWYLIARTTGEPIGEPVSARDLMREIAEAAWRCADPGVQYDTVINQWHTCPASGRINASNPCSEYMHVDDSACNLASLNLMKFRRADGSFDVESFQHAVDVMLLAQEIVVSPSSYPTEEIGKNARAFRQLGLGYANLGAYLMSNGMPYDSDEGRATAAAITSLMTGRGYLQSARVAAAIGPYERYAENREPHNAVMRMHRDAAYEISDATCSDAALLEVARSVWDEAVTAGEEHGYRNAQATVCAPTGTISFLMDCDTTGVEPDFSLVKYKELVGGGQMTIVNRTVPLALQTLGYDDQQIEQIVAYINEHGTIVGAPDLTEEHMAVFDVAVGERAISPMGHIEMMGAVQPFISGAISKTVNMPESTDVEDIADAYMQAWRLGVKALAIYRDGSKTAQALRTNAQKEAPAPVSNQEQIDRAVKEALAKAPPKRRRMPRERQSLTHKFSIGGHEGYITAGMYDDGTVGEIFLTDIGKEGSTLRGMMNSFATAISISLQYGVPLETLVRKFSYMRFEPEGMTSNPEIPFAKSMPDYIMRWLASRFLDVDLQEELGILTKEVRARKAAEDAASSHASDTAGPTSETNGSARGEGNGAAASGPKPAGSAFTDSPPVRPAVGHGLDLGPACQQCGAMMQRTGSCYTCSSCGFNTGCG